MATVMRHKRGNRLRRTDRGKRGGMHRERERERGCRNEARPFVSPSRTALICAEVRDDGLRSVYSSSMHSQLAH